MSRGRIWEILAHPAVISFIIWSVILLIGPVDFSRYRVTYLHDEFRKINTYFYYRDLDSDGESEMVSFDLNDTARTQIIFYKDNKIIGGQYDLRFRPMTPENVFFDDYNNDGISECYVFTGNEDSIFLNIIDGIQSKRKIVENVFIDFRHTALNSMSFPFINYIGKITLPGREAGDNVFIITTGFSLQPRNIYRYDIDKDILVKSPESGAPIIGCRLSDINNDQIPEILLDILATGNLDVSFPYSDRFTWLMILDYNLKFLFPPVKLENHPARLQIVPLKFGDSVKIVAFRDYYGSEEDTSSFCIYSKDGKLIARKLVSDFEMPYASIYQNEENKNTFYFLRSRLGVINELDSSFKVVRKLSIPPVESWETKARIDADNDGHPEYIFRSADLKSLIFVTDDFRNYVSWKMPTDFSEFFLISRVLEKGVKPSLFVQTNSFGTYIRFEKNKLYYLKYPVYLILYLVIFLFISLIARLQKYRLNIKSETEKKIAGLQMRAIRNQADPHFTLNVLNAIGSLYATETDRQKADYLFGKYARLIRQTVISSDQIIVSLEDELDFIKNYLDLEKFRKENSFNYEISIAKGIDTGLKIPRMLIHTFVENALKYGVRNRGGGGFINIAVSTEGNNYQVVVEDNGTGIDKDASQILGSGSGSGSGTGKGMKILDELIELYRKLERKNIAYRLENLSEEPDNKTGLRVIITIPFRKSGSGN